MGHTRIGRIPKSKSWESILNLLNADEIASPKLSVDEIAAIANESILATEKGLIDAANDTGVCEAIFIVAKTLEAIALKDSRNEFYINIENISGIREFAYELNSKIRAYFLENSISTDKAEIALKAISKSIAEIKFDSQLSLLGDINNNQNINKLASKVGFASFGQLFIANFTNLYSNFFLSRLTNFSVGSERLQNINELTHFNVSASQHWNESSYIVRSLSGDWFAKRVYFEKNINRSSVRAFLSLAFRKMSAEAKTQRGAR